jgi:soluble lytic murein transglycosylase
LRKKTRGKIKILIVLSFLILIVLIAINSSSYVLKYLYPIKYSEYVEKYSLEYKLDKNLVYSVIKAESGFDPKAVSKSNAKGLMQILDSTGKWAAEKIKIKDFESSMLLEPQTNIRIGCWYIAKLLSQYDQNIDLALAAYNAGSGNVSKWLKDTGVSKDGKTLDNIPFEETREYVSKINKYNKMYKKLYDKQN